ncbi:MAG: hypothetical protein MAG794_01671 [Gammaproteobacteria bacterium]|nr:hypothetical protein [Gammaproteobacteria bacterium]
MSEQDLKELIDKLRKEVEALPNDDVEARERLNAIIGELDKKRNEPGTEDHQGLVGNIQDSIKELEVRHPDTTTLLNNVMMTLANMGI